MPEYTIVYFNVRGRAEVARMLMADQGLDWKEETLTFDTWKKGDLKKECVFGQLPLFKDGDFKLYQSKAMVRYLARNHDLYGQDNKEASKIDMVADGVKDLRMKFIKLVFHNYKVGKAAYLENLPKDLQYFESILSNNNGGKGFIIGDRISLADYHLLDILLVHLIFSEDSCLKDFPLLRSYVDRLSTRPNLKTYLESEVRKSRRITGSGNI